MKPFHKNFARAFFVFILLAGFLLYPANELYAQDAVIEGEIRSAVTDEPLPGANIVLRGTTIGSATNIDGTYRFTVPATRVTGESVELVASFVGYRQRVQTITLTAGTHNVDFTLARDVLGLEEVVVTGVVGATHRERLPFTVGLVSRTDLEQVPWTSADQALRGKIAGVTIVKGSGQPGASSSIRLRGATSITHSLEPLYIVDGAILSGPLVDFDALDIESIEVVKGAAAASMYGSRAASGVINITTRRGRELGMNQTNITVRSEWGFNQLPNTIPRNMSHFYRVDDPNNPGTYLDEDGNPVPKESYDPATGTYVDNRVIDAWPENDGIYFADKPFPTGTQLYDHVDNFFNPGVFSLNSVSISGRTVNTNFLVSAQNMIEPGVISWDRSWSGVNPATGEQLSYSLRDGLDGYTRRNVRVNLDHRLSPELSLSVSGSFANSVRDDYPGGLFGLLLLPPDVDVLAPNDDGEPYRIRPGADVTEQSNPLYAIANADLETTRQRFLTSAELRYSPLDWLNFETNLGFDRRDTHAETFYDQGFKTLLPSLLNEGQYGRSNRIDVSLNSSFDVNVVHNFGQLATNTRLRYLAEMWDIESMATTGRAFTVPGIRNWDNTDREQVLFGNHIERVRSEGFFFITGLDYDGRYIMDFLVRRDGSSLFGPDDRWQTYYRVSGAYRMAQEDWWPSESLNEFKLRYSIGTAGGRPRFDAQFETWSFVAGSPLKRTLGNRELIPEFSTEQEIGLEIGFRDRILLELVYSNTITEDALMLVPLSGIFGYSHRWENAGEIESNTFEASLRAFALQRRDMALSFNFNFDITDMVINHMDVPCYTWGPQLQNANVFYNCDGEKFGTFYGDMWMTSFDQLPDGLPRNQFDINDDGYVVWVGDGNTWQDGIADRLWGTSTSIDGQAFNWGMPIKFIDEDGNQLHPLGRAVPDFAWAFGTNFRYKNLSLYALLESEVGHNIYNMQKQWPMRDSPTHGDLDQSGKPDGQKKPHAYYVSLYNIAAPNSHFVEDGTYVKLRELSLRYRFDSSMLRPIFGGWVRNIAVGVIGRNLLTWTDYSGFDPEIGVAASNTGFGTYGYAPQSAGATIVRFDGTQAYPNYRSYTFFVEINF